VGNRRAPAGVYESTDAEAGMTELLAQVPVDFICSGILGALGLRKLVRMERYHWPRVVILTGLLWVPPLYLFSYAFPASPGCWVPLEESDAYTITEM
jgi:hypothetical protein